MTLNRQVPLVSLQLKPDQLGHESGLHCCYLPQPQSPQHLLFTGQDDHQTDLLSASSTVPSIPFNHLHTNLATLIGDYSCLNFCQPSAVDHPHTAHTLSPSASLPSVRTESHFPQGQPVTASCADDERARTSDDNRFSLTMNLIRQQHQSLSTLVTTTGTTEMDLRLNLATDNEPSHHSPTSSSALLLTNGMGPTISTNSYRTSSLISSPTQSQIDESETGAYLVGSRPNTDSTPIDTAMPPKKLTTDDIPVLGSFDPINHQPPIIFHSTHSDPFPGQYGFDLYRPLCGDTYEASETKPSTAFFYFKDEQGWTNLFAKKTPTWWTLSYWCQRQPPEGSFIRLTPVYGTSDKQQEVIQRCFEDFMAIPTNSMGRYSIVVVGNSLADYFFDPTTKRLCVSLPYEKPKEGCEYSQFNGKFICFNSCLYNGGQGNKKPLFLIITLERPINGLDPSKSQCEVLGRQCIKFRSCACPKRDKENNERRTGDSTAVGSVGQGIQTSVKRRLDRTDKSGRKRPRTQSSDHGVNRSPSTVSTSLINNVISSSLPFNGSSASNTSNGCGWPFDPTDTLDHHHRLDPLRWSNLGTSDLMDGSAVNSNLVQYDGESYHLLIVPANLPGAAETISGVRLGLMRAWLASNPVVGKKQASSWSPQFGGGSLDGSEPEEVVDNGKTNGDVRKQHLVDQQISLDFAFRRLISVEAQLSCVLNERMAMLSAYRSISNPSGESTDSQPNSAGTTSLSLGSTTDDVMSSNHDYTGLERRNSATANNNNGCMINTTGNNSNIHALLTSDFTSNLQERDGSSNQITSTQLIENMLATRSPSYNSASNHLGATSQLGMSYDTSQSTDSNHLLGLPLPQQPPSHQSNGYTDDQYQTGGQTASQFYALSHQLNYQSELLESYTHHQQQSSIGGLSGLYTQPTLVDPNSLIGKIEGVCTPLSVSSTVVGNNRCVELLDHQHHNQHSPLSTGSGRKSTTTPNVYYTTSNTTSPRSRVTKTVNANAEYYPNSKTTDPQQLFESQRSDMRFAVTSTSKNKPDQRHLTSATFTYQPSDGDCLLNDYLDRDVKMFDDTDPAGHQSQHQSMTSHLMQSLTRACSNISPPNSTSCCVDKLALIKVD